MTFQIKQLQALSAIFCLFFGFISNSLSAGMSTDNKIVRSINVSGTGKTTVAPDKADLTLAIEAQGKNAEVARNLAANAMAELIKAIKSHGVAEKDIQTRSVSLYPSYSPDTANKIIGYQLSNQVAVCVRDLDKLGDIMDSAVSAGGNLTRIQGVSFSIENPDEALKSAREKAFADAKSKAEQYAKLSGLDLVAPINISEGSHIPVTPMPYAEMRTMKAVMDGGSSTPVQIGEQEVSVTVDVMFGVE